MAAKTTKTTVISVGPNTVIATHVTAVNVALAAFDGSGVAGNANQYKFVQGVENLTVYDGTDINYVTFITAVDTAAVPS